MKRILATIALVAMCSAASAATISWSIAAKAFGTSDGSSERAASYYVSVFLYDNYDSVVSALGTLGSAAESSISTISSYEQSNGTTAKTGMASGNFTTTEASGTTIQLFMVAFDATSIGSASNYLISDAVASDAYAGTDVPTNQGKFTNASFSSSSWTPIAAVPEPSTAALALAGLALLIKRRKA